MRIVLTSFLALVLLPCGAMAVQEHDHADQEKKERKAKIKKQVEKVQKAVKAQRQVAVRQRERVRVERQVERKQKAEQRRSVLRKIETKESKEVSRFGRHAEAEERAHEERAHREHAEEWSSLLRGVKERRPELAKRLGEMLKDNPKHFEDVLMRALMGQIENALERQERGGRGRLGRSAATPREPSRAERPRRPERARRPERRRLPAEPREERARETFTRRIGELRALHRDREAESRKLASQLRNRLRADVRPRDQENLRGRLRDTVREHFELRSELRRIDLSRIESELARLREAVEQLRIELEHRQRERGAIIERRIRELTRDRD
jgi:hypothetical protein